MAGLFFGSVLCCGKGSINTCSMPFISDRQNGHPEKSRTCDDTEIKSQCNIKFYE